MAESISNERVEGEGGEQWAKWLIEKKEELDDVGNPKLKTELRLLARRPDTLTDSRVLSESYERIDKMIRDGDLKPEEAALWQVRIGERHQKLVEFELKTQVQRQSEQSINNKGNLAESIVNVLEGRRISDIDEYRLFQREEEWQNQPFAPIDPRLAPGFYIKWFDLKEREIFNKRRELATAAFRKRHVSPPTLSDLSKAENESLGGFSKAETATLYRQTGVKEAMKLYLDLWEGKTVVPNAPQKDGKTLSIREVSGTSNEVFYREFIRNRIAPQFKDRVLKEAGVELGSKEFREWLSIYARDAEQIAFNLLYTGNTFESLESQWKDGRRVVEMKSVNKFLHVAIRNAMNPLDALIATFKKGESEFSNVGRFGEWAYRQTKLSAGGTDVGKGFDEVDLVPEIKGNENKFWTIEKRGGKTVLHAVECYPTKMIGSLWEETKVEIDGNKVPLIDLLRKGEDIPWEDSSIPDGMWGDYNGKLDKSGAVWDLLQGKTLIRWGEYENVGLWVQDVNNALAKFQLRNELDVKRWILYASSGSIDAKKRAPRFAFNKQLARKLLGDSGPTYLHNNQLFFPWDGEGLLAIL